ncbi:MAG: glycosyltransferase family 4 protein, partial [Planctomycetia bacterium]|nr:glycosyltransferase family 4 protein [Planctomycetia bacterium]
LGRAGGGHEFIVIVDRPSAEVVEVPGGFERVVVEVGEAPSRAASSTGRRSLADLLAMGRAAARARLDLLYFPATYSYFPVWGVRRVVVTMHDTLALARPDLVFPTWQGRVAWALKEHAAARRADRILTVSEAARRDLLAWFGLPGDRVRVVTEGPEDVFGPRPVGPGSDAALARYGVEPGGRYLLYVGGLSPHKNLPRLIEAFGRSGLGVEGFRLVLVGDTGDVFHTHVPELRAAVARAGLGGRVVFTGFVPDEDLVFVYNRAEALVQPSLMEGFGLPPVEAMACGTPVLASTAGSLPEVVGDAGLSFDPTDVGAIASGLRRVIDEPGLRAELAARALRRASRFTWAASARGILDCFEEFGPGPAKVQRRSA